jgi:hypothetical protein
MGGGCIDPHFLYLGISWRWVVSFTPQPLYPPYPLERRRCCHKIPISFQWLVQNVVIRLSLCISIICNLIIGLHMTSSFDENVHFGKRYIQRKNSVGARWQTDNRSERLCCLTNSSLLTSPQTMVIKRRTKQRESWGSFQIFIIQLLLPRNLTRFNVCLEKEYILGRGAQLCLLLACLTLKIGAVVSSETSVSSFWNTWFTSRNLHVFSLRSTMACLLKAGTVKQETAVAMQWPRERGGETKSVSRQQLGKHVSAATTWRPTMDVFFREGGFLRGSSSGLISTAEFKVQFSCETVANRQRCERETWRISSVRSRYQETTTGHCNRLRTVVCVKQWTVKCGN